MDSNIAKSRFWLQLWQHYRLVPSIAMCRVPELEYAATLEIREKKVLDHCCGDGIFASLAWQGEHLTAGCDLSESSVKRARDRNIYTRTDICDASQRLPYDDGEFDLVFDNSSIEHIPDVNKVLGEVARVLDKNGLFAFNIVNHRFFEWWPLSDASKRGYRKWQPVYHAFNLDSWQNKLQNAGLKIVSVEGYFDRPSARLFALLDCEFSGWALARRPSFLVLWYRLFPSVLQNYWQQRIEKLSWKTAPDAGAGYFIKAAHI